MLWADNLILCELKGLLVLQWFAVCSAVWFKRVWPPCGAWIIQVSLRACNVSEFLSGRIRLVFNKYCSTLFASVSYIHELTISMRTLRRFLKCMGLYRRKNECDPLEVASGAEWDTKIHRDNSDCTGPPLAHNKPTLGPTHHLHLPYINYTNKMFGFNGKMTTIWQKAM